MMKSKIVKVIIPLLSIGEYISQAAKSQAEPQVYGQSRGLGVWNTSSQKGGPGVHPCKIFDI